MTEDLKLRDDQMASLVKQIQLERGGFWDDPGVGKTPKACMWMYYLWTKKATRTVWAMPSHLMDKNRRELLLWSNFNEEDVIIVDGSRANRDKAISSNAKVFITTFPGLVGANGWQLYKKEHSDFNSVVLDEPHKYFSNHDSASTQELYRCMRTVKFFLAMTGTVIKGRLDSAYPMIQIIQPKFYGNDRDFAAQHTIKDLYGTVIGWRNHEKLAQVLDAIGSRTSFQEVYGDRDIAFFIEEVDMSPAQRQVYDEFKAAGFAEINDVFMDASNEGVNLLRLRQILAHPEQINLPATRDYEGKPLTYHEVCVDKGPTNRDLIIQGHLEEHKRTGEPLLILSSLKIEQRRLVALARKVGLSVSLINSDVPNEERFRIDREFQAGNVQVVVGSPATVSTGFNWPHLNHILFASLDFSADDVIQALMRGFRGKRTQVLKATLVQYRRSVEQAIDEILDRKSRESNLVDPTYYVLNLGPSHRNASKGVYFTTLKDDVDSLSNLL